MASVSSSLRNLQRDLASVARDAEALWRATADIASDQVQSVRNQTESSLKQAQRSLRRAKWREPLRGAYETTSGYVREHPWAVLGAVAGLAVLIGLSSRRSD
jgi:ElaB/YqjD/DUF883 family membrane-anchored ribosome-binding protein